MKKPPDIKPVDLGVIAEPGKIVLENEIPVYLFEAGTEEIMRIEFTFGAGNAFEVLPLVASTTNLMLSEGSPGFSAIKLNRILDFYGVYYNLYCERDRAGIVVYCMNRHLEKVLELVKGILFYPLFPVTELKSLMKKRLRSFLVNREKVNSLATDQFFESIFGSHHPYGRQTLVEDFKIMNPFLLRDFHSVYYRPQNLCIIAAGKIPRNFATLLNHNFGNTKSHLYYVEESVDYLSGQKEKKVHIEKPGSVQCSLKIGSVTINKRHPDYPALKILNVILGGYFGSRLMKNLREDKGYTYGINSSVTSLNLSGYKIISAEVSKNITQFAIEEIYKEIRLLQSVPVEKEELDMVKNYMLGDMVRMFDGPFALAEAFRSVWEFGLDNLYYYRLADKINTISPDEITEAARTYYNIEDLYQITAG